MKKDEMGKVCSTFGKIKKYTQKVSCKNLMGKEPSERAARMLEIFKMDFKYLGYECLEWIELDVDMVQ